jgi:hypothetical protein
MQASSTDVDVFYAIAQEYRITEIVQSADEKGWEHVWLEFGTTCDQAAFKTEQEKNIFIDLFFHQCLLAASPPKSISLFWEMIDKWFAYRQLESRAGALSEDEKTALLQFCLSLRMKLRELILNVPLDDVGKLSDCHQRLMLGIWRLLFLEPFSILNLYWNPTHDQSEVLEECKTTGYKGLLIASMYHPFSADEYFIDTNEVIGCAALPFCYKFIIIHWMVNTPYFNAEEKHRLKILKYVPELCQAIIRHPQNLTSLFFLMFVQEVMTGFWRASYIGGNNVEALSAFGDFIHLVMSKSHIHDHPKAVPKSFEKGEKIRVGYISRNFYMQAVSLYMVNRVIHHDLDKFEIYVFALGDQHDLMSELFKQHSDYFEHFPNLTDISGIVRSILDQKLDILIYTDIGMDAATYILSGLQLAPVQCAMVGHGTTTGMPTIQYYLSGDFEPSDAQSHYREKLVCLPNLGAAQYPLINPEEAITRQFLGIPDDAVVFISCANGIKHGKSRDALFIEILKQAPNAWIVLKPFAAYSSIDYIYARRLREAAKEAGVADRLLLLPPIGLTKHVMGLLAIADVQLDSYPYGGWTTNMETFYMGLPIVTQQGNLARSRWGAGMLKAFGITEGIANNEEEYIRWAVTLAQDTELRQRLKNHISTTVKDVLFNGAVAQPAFESALINIHHETCTVQKNILTQEPVPIKSEDPITVATSLRPGNFDTQYKAVMSWENAGFNVVSINSIDEIAVLYPNFPNVTFVATEKDGRDEYGAPYIYFDDILRYFSCREGQICGIISPDIYLTQDNFLSCIRHEAIESVVYGSRVDVAAFESCDGQMYSNGFDYFFFDKKMISYYPPQAFCIGLPWFDYWTVLVPLMHKLPVKRVISPIALHIKHPPAGNEQIWLSLGANLAKNFHPPFEISSETMLRYATETLTIIHELSQKVAI